MRGSPCPLVLFAKRISGRSQFPDLRSGLYVRNTRSGGSTTTSMVTEMLSNQYPVGDSSHTDTPFMPDGRLSPTDVGLLAAEAKLSRMLFTVLLTPLMAFGAVLGVASIPTVTPVLSQNAPSPPNQSSGGSRFAEVPPWNDTFFSNEPPDSSDGGSRGQRLCLIAPLDQTTGVEVWSDRPTFIWQGQFARVELYAQNSETPIWSQDLSPDDQQIQYTGAALQPGQNYDLMLYESVSEPVPFARFRVTFQVMDGAKRDQVEQGLKQLDAQLKQQGASSEVIAHARFKYWAERQLWSDALIEPFLVENPSPDLQKFLQETIPDEFCD